MTICRAFAQLYRDRLLGCLLSLSILAGCSRPHASADLPVLKVASQKGGTKALVLASHVLDGAPYRVEWSEFPSAQALLEALSAGAVDLGSVGDAPFLFAYANNPKLKVVHLAQSDDKAAVSASAASAVAVMVPGKSSIRTIDDLKGRKIATGKGSIGHYLLLRLLQKAHVKPSEVEVVYLAPGDAKAALASGAVDAWSTWIPYTNLEQHDGGRVVANGVGVLHNYLFEASNDAAVHAKRPQVLDFIGRLAKAERWEADHGPVFAKVLTKETGLPNDVALDMAQIIPHVPRTITPEVVLEEQGVLAVYHEAGVIAAPAPISAAFDASFNAALAR